MGFLIECLEGEDGIARRERRLVSEHDARGSDSGEGVGEWPCQCQCRVRSRVTIRSVRDGWWIGETDA